MELFLIRKTIVGPVLIILVDSLRSWETLFIIDYTVFGSLFCSNVVEWWHMSGRKAYMRYLDDIYKQSDISWFTPVELSKVHSLWDENFL